MLRSSKTLFILLPSQLPEGDLGHNESQRNNSRSSIEEGIYHEGSTRSEEQKTRVELPGDKMGKITNSHVIYQLMGAGAMGFGSLVSLMVMGYTSPALPSMRADPNFSITPEQESWVGAVMPACGLLGSAAAGQLVDRVGRRATLLHLTWPFMLSWALIAVSDGVCGVLAGRMVAGVCVGVFTTARSVFLPETIELDLRSVSVAFPAIFSNLGLMVIYGAGQFLSWRGLAWLGLALCLPILALLLPLPETPYHLTRTGRREESLAALQKLRRSAGAAEREQQEISSSCSRDTAEVSVWELVQPPNLWPVGVAAGLMLTAQTTGMKAIIFFASSILKGDSNATPLLGLASLLGSVAGTFLLTRCKRRRLLQVSTAIVVTSLLTLVAFCWAQEAGGAFSAVAEALHLVPVAALVVHTLGCVLGWQSVPWVFLSEGMPSRVRGKAVAAAVAINWALTFLVTKTFGWCLAAAGAHTTFLGYAAATVVSTGLVLRVMPETFGRSVADMDRLYLAGAGKKDK